MTLSPGARLGPYEIAAPVGAGGMGEVYRARDTRLGRTVAIKVLPSGVSADPDRRRRFEQEARAASALNHPHICTLYDIGSENGTDFLVMEYLEGQTLAERLARGLLPLGQVLQYGMQIADALDKAHRQGIIHRDLKPGNVMLTKAGTLLYVSGGVRLSQRRLMWADRRNESRPVSEDRRSFSTPRFSPDGRRLVMTIEEASDNIWIYDGRFVRRTFAGGSNVAPIWTPDGKQITFSSNRAGAYTLFSMPADGSGAATQILPNDRVRFPGSWSADGRTLAFVELNPTSGSDIWILRTGRDARPEPFLQSPFDERDPEFSPDGRCWPTPRTSRDGQRCTFVRSGQPERDSRSRPTAAPSRAGHGADENCSIARATGSWPLRSRRSRDSR